MLRSSKSKKLFQNFRNTSAIHSLGQLVKQTQQRRRDNGRPLACFYETSLPNTGEQYDVEPNPFRSCPDDLGR
ncbi:hypothetical protein CA13_03300 [Planctomycetes bacterium CA13]|uniref:Uncharacterized protein n=1 Tax=Novipirellula herctigrandis TaxID=2527986 RepID=A0A5C5YWK8_9BACT|nr:hypothetical protein CA13_03300 [Planctomycetes bacterium CA13]